jgi:CheY-like chemotaxis protein
MKSQNIEKNTTLKPPPAKKYLVVDDDDNFRYLLLNLFEGEAEVLQGDNGKEALALMETNCFDVVLCDVNMPIMSGIEFCRKAMSIDIEFAKYTIILTGDRSGEVRSFCNRNKILLLYKPLSISALKASVKVLLMKNGGTQLIKEEAYMPFKSDRGCSLVAKPLSGNPESHKAPVQDRRQLERIKVSIPALILEAVHPIRELSTGTILDFSSRGIRFSVPKEARVEINTVSKINEFSVILTMPGASQPIIVKCRPNRILDSEREVQVGAVSVVTDVLNHINWQQYLH